MEMTLSDGMNYWLDADTGELSELGDGKFVEDHTKQTVPEMWESQDAVVITYPNGTADLFIQGVWYENRSGFWPWNMHVRRAAAYSFVGELK